MRLLSRLSKGVSRGKVTNRSPSHSLSPDPKTFVSVLFYVGKDSRVTQLRDSDRNPCGNFLDTSRVSWGGVRMDPLRVHICRLLRYPLAVSPHTLPSSSVFCPSKKDEPTSPVTRLPLSLSKTLNKTRPGTDLLLVFSFTCSYKVHLFSRTSFRSFLPSCSPLLTTTHHHLFPSSSPTQSSKRFRCMGD